MQPERRQIIKLGEPGMRAALVKYAGSAELKTELSSHIKPVEIITKTKHGQTLSQEEIFGWVNGITSGKVKDYQTSAWLMAVCLRQPPLSKDETVDLTLAMAASGEVLNLDEFGIVADKHSSGGVGDKTTLVVAPMVAACDVKVGKMSGRGLGHTGGTLDKLESIPGFRVDLNKEEFISQTDKVGIVVTGQTGDLAPADGILYSLRDVTGTVDSIPLIAASIMSKKIASGANTLVLDVKVGSGAFMKTLDEARELARTMVDIGKSVGMKVIAEISDMNQPLGEAVGNSLEVLEAINTLKGNGPPDFYEHCIDTAAQIILLAGKAENMEVARGLVERTITEGTALEKFRDMVRAQGGDENVVDSPEDILSRATPHDVYYEGEDGYIGEVDPMAIGLTAMHLGGGREKKGDSIDYSVGVVTKCKVGKQIKKGDLIGVIYTDDQSKIKESTLAIQNGIIVGKDFVAPPPLIHEIIE